MVKATISLRAPVSADKMEGWVAEQIDRLRDESRDSGVRVGRLSAALPPQAADWVVEVDLHGRDVPLEDDMALARLLMDIDALGLRPQLLLTSLPDALQPPDAELRRRCGTMRVPDGAVRTAYPHLN